MILSERQIEGHRVLVMDPPIVPPGAPVLVTLHGLGTNGEDLASLCDELHFPRCRFVLPDAPLSLPGYPPGAYAWYDFQAFDLQEVEQSRGHLFKVFDRFVNDPNLRPGSGDKGPSPLVVWGFSQGGVMALEAGLNYKGKMAAIVSMSGYMPDPYATLLKAEAPFETPILLIHGTMDEVVPVEGSRQAHGELKKAGYNPVLMEFPMGHQISAESLAAAREFLARVLNM